MPEENIQKKVLEVIESGSIKMKPRWHFVLKSGFLVVGLIFLVLFLIYLSSFIVFVLRQSGVLFVPTLGFAGVRVFLASAPWLLISLALLFVCLLQIMVKRFAFGYARPLLYSSALVVVVAVVGGVLVEMTPLHTGLLIQSEEMHLPIAGVFYRQFAQVDGATNITLGKIVGFLDDDVQIQTREGEVWIVRIDENTLGRRNGLVLGDNIVVLGERIGKEISALGISRFLGRNFRHSPLFMQKNHMQQMPGEIF